jgi:hypothetical protein
MPAVFARLLVLFFAALGAWAALRVLRQLQRESRAGTAQRNGHTTFKPGQRKASQAAGQAGTPFIMARAQLEGLRDALTSASLDPSQPLSCCGQCRSIYHQTSIDALHASHKSACIACGSTDLAPVLLQD